MKLTVARLGLIVVLVFVTESGALSPLIRFGEKFGDLKSIIFENNVRAYMNEVAEELPVTKANLTLLTDKIVNSEEIDENLKKVNNMTQDLVDIMNAKIPDQKSLPPLIPAKINSDDQNTTEKTFKQVLTNFTEEINHDIQRMRLELDRLYLEAWAEARENYHKKMITLRTKYINVLVPFFGENIEKIEAQGEVVRTGASSETWEEFERLGRIIKGAHQVLKEKGEPVAENILV